MRKFKLEIEMDNAAFDDASAAELRAILGQAMQRSKAALMHCNTYGDDRFTLRDSNGNTIGHFEIKETGSGQVCGDCSGSGSILLYDPDEIIQCDTCGGMGRIGLDTETGESDGTNQD